MDYLNGLLRMAGALALLTGIGAAHYAWLRRLVRRILSGRSALARRLFCGVLGLLLSAATLLLACNFYVYHGFGHQPDIFRHGKRTGNMVAITFDDGPSALYTLKILDILREYKLQATFFLVGRQVEKYPDIARRIAEMGHEIGNHTYDHRNLPTLGYLALKREVLSATEIILAATGVYPDFIRPPRGMYDGRSRRLAHLLGQQTVLWSVSGKDWQRGVRAGTIVKNVLSKARGGDVILFHDSGALLGTEGGDRTATVRALPAIIEGLRKKGLRIVPLKILLADEDPAQLFPTVDRHE